MSSFEGSAPLPWESKPVSTLLRLASPIAVSMISYSAMTLVGTAFVGRLGPAQLAGVGLAGVYVFALLCFAFGLFRGLKVLVSQAVGAGRAQDSGRFLAAGLVWALGLGFFVVLVSRGVAPLLTSLTATGEAGQFASTYLWIRTLAAPAVLAACALREVRQGLGDSRSSMISSVTANLVNAGLDVLFIVVLHYGVAGAAWAAVVGHVVDVGVLAFIHWRAGPKMTKPSRGDLRAVWSLGLPIAVQFMLEVGSFALVSALLAGMGDLEIASHQVALNLIQFSFLPAIALGEAGSVLVGQAVGAGKEHAVLGLSRLAMKLAIGYAGVCSLLFVVFGPFILRLFTPDETLRHATMQLLYIGAAFQLADGAAITARSSLRGTGDVRYAAWTGIVLSWVCLPPLTLLLGKHLGWGARGGWTAIFVEVAFGAALYWRRLVSMEWQKSVASARAIREGAGMTGMTVPDALEMTLPEPPDRQ